MKLYAPSYYKNFKCAADKCEHSCCVGWEIDIDADTLSKYEALTCEYGNFIKESVSKSGTPHFKLAEGERCPHLDSQGLCKIITNLGENYLCDICREHPRFYNYTGVAELGIGMSCREAAKIILSSPDYAKMECIGEIDADDESFDFDARALREKIYGILNSPESYSLRLEKIYKSFSIKLHSDAHYLKILDSLEYLDSAHKDLFKCYSSQREATGFDSELERFLAYFVYRHTTEAEDDADFKLRLAFCLFCERLFASLICKAAPKSTEELAALASIISEEIEYSDENTEILTY